MVALGKKYFLLSRHTSLIVLENDAMYAQYGVTKGAGDTWAPYALPAKIPVITAAAPVITPPDVAADAALVRAPLRLFYGPSHQLDVDVAGAASSGILGSLSGELEGGFGFGLSGIGLGGGGTGWGTIGTGRFQTIGRGSGTGQGFGVGGGRSRGDLGLTGTTILGEPTTVTTVPTMPDTGAERAERKAAGPAPDLVDSIEQQDPARFDDDARAGGGRGPRTSVSSDETRARSRAGCARAASRGRGAAPGR